MTIYKTAYDTTATSGFVTAKIASAIKEASVSGEVNRLGNEPIVMIEGAGTYGESVPPFSHPFSYPYKGWGEEEKNMVAVDVRPFGKYNRDSRTFVVGANKVEYNLTIARARLQVIWLERDPEVLRDISQMPMAVYASWLSENIARRYALEPLEQFNVSIVAAIFYASQFHNETSLNERDKLRIVNAISRNLRCKPDEVLKIIDQVDVIPDISGFCEKAAEIASPVRLAHFNAALLITILGSSWYGTNHREVLAVALEHPPTWIAILMAASSERYYHSTPLARIVERYAKNDTGKNFMYSMLRLLEVTAKN